MADTLSQDSTLDINQAGAAFAELLEPPKPDPVDTPVVDTEIDTAETAEPEEKPAEIEDEIKLVPVVINGKTVEVPLSEVLAEYQKGKASTEKFEAASALKKEALAEKQQAQQAREDYANNLNRMAAQLEGVLQAQSQVDMNALLESDPVEYLKQTRLAEQRQAQLIQINHQRGLIEAQRYADFRRAEDEDLAYQHEQLIEKLPEWRDKTKASKEREALAKYLIDFGYKKEDVVGRPGENGRIEGGIKNHLAILLARKAMLYDQTIAKAVAASKRVATLPPKVERPGVADTPVMDKRSAAYQRLGKTGRVEDAAALFSALL